jgi:hypothetical protein
MSEDEDQRGPQSGQRRGRQEHALQLGPRKKPCVILVFPSMPSSSVIPLPAVSLTLSYIMADISVERNTRCATFALC